MARPKGKTKPRVTRGFRMSYHEWLDLRALAREDGCTTSDLVRELVKRERARRIAITDALAQAEAAKVPT